jgi:hypothetical protein
MLRGRPHEPAQPLAAIHEGVPDGAGLGCDQHVAEPLMIPLPVVARDELVEGAEQATLPEHDQAVRHLSRLETSLALASRLGDARCRRLDLPSARLADWDQDAPGDGICEGATLSLLERALPSGGLRERARRGRPSRDQATRW